MDPEIKIRLVPSCSSPFHVLSALISLLISPRLLAPPANLHPQTRLSPGNLPGPLSLLWGPHGLGVPGRETFKLSETYIYHPNSQASPFFFLLLPALSSHRRAIRSCEAWNSWVSRGTLKDNEQEEMETEGLRAWYSTRNRPTQTSSYTKVIQNKQIPWARKSTRSSAV